MQVVNMSNGRKVPYELRGTTLDFADGALAIDLSRWQEDDPVTVDIKATRKGHLTTGRGSYYVAQVKIPGRKYTEPSGDSGGTEGGTGGGERKPIPLNTDETTLCLFSIDGIMIR